MYREDIENREFIKKGYKKEWTNTKLQLKFIKIQQTEALKIIKSHSIIYNSWITYCRGFWLKEKKI